MKRLIYALFLFCAAASTLFAQEMPLKTLLISIEKYEISPLDFAVKDISMLGTVLTTRYGCEMKAYINSAAVHPDESPKKSIEREIASWCKSLKEADTAILYLAGHGVKDADGKVFLAMIDFDTKNFSSSAIPIQWIRDCFEKSAAAHKVIFLDTCFAGTGKNIDFHQVSAGETSQLLSEAKNVAIVASSQADEQSWLWGEAKHSLFTYWLIEALKGHADRDDDRVVTFAELTSYIQENVAWVAQNALGKSQSPVVLNAQAGKNVRFPLRAVPLCELIDDVATQIDLQMEMDRFPLIAISEFTTGMENSFGREYGILPKWMTDSLRRTLSSKARLNRKGYKVVSENTTQSLIRENGLSPDDMGTLKTANLKVEGQEIPLLVTGKLNFVGEMGISFRVYLINAQDRSEHSQIGGTARLDGKEMAMTGISGKFSSTPPSNQNIVSPTNANRQRFYSDSAVGLITEAELQETQRIQQERRKVHPLSEPKFPWRTAIEVRQAGTRSPYQPRPLVFFGNDAFLPLSQGEEYQIRVDNTSEQLVFARILVDGLNTLSQRMATSQRKGSFLEAIGDEEAEFEIAPRVCLSEARSWVLLPKVKSAPIVGFVDANGKMDTLQRFQIVDADQSEAARKGYTEQIGLITVGIFKAEKPEIGGTLRNVGTGLGRKETVTVRQYGGEFVAGEMLSAYSIRYVTPEKLAKLQKSR